MNGQQNDRGPYGTQSPPFAEWLNSAVRGVMRIFGTEGPASTESAGARPGFRENLRMAGVNVPLTPRRSLVGYINAGIYKMERARRSSAIAKQYSATLETIRLTRRAIRRSPRSSRYLFQGYTSVLRDAKRRVKQLNAELRRMDAHLRQYNPPMIEDELRRLEATLNTVSPATRMETEMRIEARTDLLTMIQEFDERIEAMSAQLGSISAALELNHVRIVTLGGIVTSTMSDEILTTRMQEVTEQLKLLQESIREL